MAPSPTRASLPMIEPRTTAPASTCAPSSMMLPSTTAPRPTRQPRPKEDRPPMVARLSSSQPSATESGGRSLTFLPAWTEGSTSTYSKPSRSVPTAPESTSWEAAR